MHMHMCFYMHMYMCICVYLYLHMHMCVYVYVYAYIRLNFKVVPAWAPKSDPGGAHCQRCLTRPRYFQQKALEFQKSLSLDYFLTTARQASTPRGGGVVPACPDSRAPLPWGWSNSVWYVRSPKAVHLNQSFFKKASSRASRTNLQRIEARVVPPPVEARVTSVSPERDTTPLQVKRDRRLLSVQIGLRSACQPWHFHLNWRGFGVLSPVLDSHIPTDDSSSSLSSLPMICKEGVRGGGGGFPHPSPLGRRLGSGPQRNLTSV